ncbi:MAG TPA: O-antigen ligase family protein [Terriglobia bacterium]|nr:O-antigen ligase family protein [Terriglobia bacterium]
MSASTSSAEFLPISIRREEAATLAGSRWFSRARVLLFAILLASPFAFGAVEPWAWAAIYVLAFAGLAFWAVGSVRRQAVKIIWTPLYVPVALFLALGAVQYLGHLTLDSFETREALVKLITDAVVFFLAGQLFGEASSRVWRRFGFAVTAYAFLMGLFAILQYFSSQGMIFWLIKSRGRIFGPYVNHNDFAGLMEMLVPIAAAYVLSRPEDDQHRVFLAFGVCVGVCSLLLSASRGGFVAFLGEIVIFAWILWRRLQEGNSRRHLLVGALGLVAATAFFFWIAPQNVTNRLSSVGKVVNAPEATYGDRMHVAYDSLLIFHDHPLLGTGLGSFGSIFPAYQTFPTNELYPYAHNDYAQALAETGVLGALIIAASLILFFRLAFGNLRRRLDQDTGWIRLGAALAVCGLLIHSFVDFNLHIPANAAWFAVCVALSTIPGTAGRMKERPAGDFQ